MTQLTGKPSSSRAAPVPFTYSCPYLGMADDPTTVTLFPSDTNLCFHCKPPTAPNSAHQSRYCLSQEFNECKLKQEFAPGKMPAKYRWQAAPLVTRATLLKAVGGLGIALFLALFFVLWLPGILSDMMLTFAPTPASGGSWPTLTPSATFENPPTAQPTAASSFTAVSTMPGAATYTPVTLPEIVNLTVVAESLACRVSTVDTSPVVATYRLGEELVALASDESGEHLFVRKPDSGIDDCWVSSAYTLVKGDTAALPVFTPVPYTYNPPAATRTFTSTATQAAQPTATRTPTKAPLPTKTPTPTSTTPPPPTATYTPVPPTATDEPTPPPTVVYTIGPTNTPAPTINPD